ncbi:MAG: aminoacyl--tRNA ligase-related protein [Candidatus Colwellbacteria bacterium]|nr:aminoacyl--tRNA ligase-related protein [Candidatus Colwellbacteria bacterium]
MRQSELFTKTRRTAPKDEVSKNGRLLIQAGYINKEMAGVYDYLPLGLRVLKKIENIIREEMNKLGGQEIFMTTLQDPTLWKKSGRWDDKVVTDWFKTRNDEFGLSNTHEEPLTNLLKNHILSYKDLPVYVYQFQTKLRYELRAKSGLMRGREFIMKDLYSFSRTPEELDRFHDKCRKAYLNVFKRAGIGNKTYLTYASGGSFTKYSYEFQTLSEAGEDIIYLDKTKKIAINKEVYDEESVQTLKLNREKLIRERSIEVGNIFKLGTRFSDALGLKYVDKSGIERPVIMGSYGIGLGRLMGAIVEVLSDDKGIIWPVSVAPFKVHLVELKKGLARGLYEKLTKAGVETLYDDRDLTPGEKFNDADLIGIPWRLVVSEKTKNKVEVKRRNAKKVELISHDELIQQFS